MKLSDLVPSLDTCRRLKAAGFPQESALLWQKPYVGDACVGWYVRGYNERLASAPTLAEVLAAMPPRIIRAPVNEPGPMYGTFYRTLSSSASHSETPYTVASFVDAWNNPMMIAPGKGVAQRVSDRDVEAASELLIALLEAGLLSASTPTGGASHE